MTFTFDFVFDLCPVFDPIIHKAVPELRDMCGRGTGVRAPLRFRLPEMQMGLCNVM